MVNLALFFLEKVLYVVCSIYHVMKECLRGGEIDHLPILWHKSFFPQIAIQVLTISMHAVTFKS